MPTYFPDTNVLIDFGRDACVRERLEHARVNDGRFVIAPPALIELSRGMIKAGRVHFEADKQVFTWLNDHNFEILPLPYPFMAEVLRSSLSRQSGVEPRHYQQLIETVSNAVDYNDFIRLTIGTAWQGIERADEIHGTELDREIAALGSLARKGLGQDFARRLSQKFGVPGCRPNPLIIANHFSAALEFLESSIVKIKGGSNPRRNDPGLYTDFQLLFYLANPDLIFLTNEDFAHEVRVSPQRFRILSLDSLA